MRYRTINSRMMQEIRPVATIISFNMNPVNACVTQTLAKFNVNPRRIPVAVTMGCLYCCISVKKIDINLEYDPAQNYRN